MSDIAKIIGQRIRNNRINRGLTQEKLAELSGCHPTYIGQVERGEKNLTIESLAKISSALDISMAQLFEKLGPENHSQSLPLKCYEFISTKNQQEQEQIYRLLMEIDAYKSI